MEYFKCDYCGQEVRPEDEIIEDGIHYHVDCYNSLCSESEYIVGRCCVCNDWVQNYDSVIDNNMVAHCGCLD